MNISVEKIDDINFIMSGTVDNSVIENKVKELKEKASKEDSADDSKVATAEQEAAGIVFQEFIDAGLKQANIDVATILGQPGLKKYEQQDGKVHFEFDLSTSPKIEVDVDYKDIIPEYTRPTADAKAIEVKLVEFALQQAPFTKIEKAKAVENNDVVVIDFIGYIDGKAFEGGDAKNFNLKVGSNSFIEGFEEQLIGMEYGEERTVTLNFPDDYQAEDLAGKEAKFEVKLHEIQEQKALTPDDEFAQKVLSDKKATLDTLKEKLGDQIVAEEVSELYMSELKPKIINVLHSKFDFTLPSNIVEQEIDAKVRVKTQSYTKEQHQTFIDDKSKFMELRESVREDARNSIKTSLIVEALAIKEGVIVHDQEVQAYIGYEAMRAKQDAQELLKYYEENNLITSIKSGIMEDKLFGMMLGFDKK